MVIDNRVAFLGGMNIGREYRYDWHDLMVEVKGPGDQLQPGQRAWLEVLDQLGLPARVLNLK